ncbi:hypothetical protein N7539_000739 [Penicillium diatomitis]|uniref:thioredoxin-dependent peroxiredoxin n=1 Tax=Penicillium diatomitis TaxID=2819901 RepID=A0A9X0C2G3_9EURO|nr:uncharacterized protein N7539_000739 [Penicillium diatomitis]KAJ5495623.1 hypothetical protein N7539_000739 [Penicillium diatomitis]
MVELRKRKAPAPPPVVEKKSRPAPKAKAAAAAAAAAKPAETTKEKPKSKVPEAGDAIDLDSFGGEVETHDGTKTTLKKLVEESKAGVVLFTYPKASTPGCTKQACSFRDNYSHLSSTGLTIYGLSADSTKANTTFKTKQNLPYSLLCDPSATLIGATGLKKSPKGTVRGVFAVDKKGKVLLREAGGPDATVDAVQKLVAEGSQGAEKSEKTEEADADAEEGRSEEKRENGAEEDVKKDDTKEEEEGEKTEEK